MLISELASRSGVPASTLRYYGRAGLLPAGRESNGYRRYGPAAVDRLAFIVHAKAIDLSLADIKELVSAWEAEPCSGVRAVYRPILEQRAAEVDDRLVALHQLRRTLSEAAASLAALPDRDVPCDADCAFLEAETLEVEAPAEPCTLDGHEHVDRIAAWRRLLDGSRPVLAGATARVTLPIDRLSAAAALAVDEQRCCAFLDISLDLHGPTFELTVTAPATEVDALIDLLAPVTRSTDR